MKIRSINEVVFSLSTRISELQSNVANPLYGVYRFMNESIWVIVRLISRQVDDYGMVILW